MSVAVLGKAEAGRPAVLPVPDRFDHGRAVLPSRSRFAHAGDLGDEEYLHRSQAQAGAVVL